jgi:hypothetical protein
MIDEPRFELERLRQIGWALWNPIGLDDAWKADGADEYDPYLLHVADMSAEGASDSDAAEYLVTIAAEHMGLSHVDNEAASATASAIASYVRSRRKRR